MKQRMNRITLLLTLLGVALLSHAFGQDSLPSLNAKPRKPDSFRHRISVGGNLGLQFGTVTGITIAPEAALRTIDHLHVGLRAIYQYNSYKDYFQDINNGDWKGYKSNVYGGGIFLRYYLYSLFDNFIGNFFAHAEYEYLYLTRPYVPSATGNYLDPWGNRFASGKDVIEINSIFAGGGYRQPVGNRVYLDLLVLFNLNDTYNSPYNNPVVRIGVAVGL